MYNQDYNLPNSWYEEPDYDSINSCNQCEEKNRILEIAQDYLSNVIKLIYSKEELDVAELDDALSELCVQLDVEHPTNMPNLQRANFLKYWIESNNHHLKSLA